MTIKANQGPLPDKPLRRPIFGIWETEDFSGDTHWRARIFMPAPDGGWVGEYSNLWAIKGAETLAGCPWQRCCYAKGFTHGNSYQHGVPWKWIQEGVRDWFTHGTCVAWMYL